MNTIDYDRFTGDLSGVETVESCGLERPQAKSFPQETTGPVAAGLAVVAGDTGRVLLMQRQLDPDDPNSGKFEFPGGKVEDGVSPLETAVKEWVEEVGLPLPPGQLDRSRRWVSGNGKYAGFVYRVASEADVPIYAERRGDADPDSGGWAAVAWVAPADLPHHNLRPALLGDLDDVLAQVVKWLRRGGGKMVRKGVVTKGTTYWQLTYFSVPGQRTIQRNIRESQETAITEARRVSADPDFKNVELLKVTDPSIGQRGRSRAVKVPFKSFSQDKGWRRAAHPHYSQTIDGVELRLVNLGTHMGQSRWRLGVVGGDGEVAWRHDGRTRAEAEDRVADVVKEELRQRKGLRRQRTKAPCKPGQTAESTRCTPLGGGGGSDAGKQPTSGSDSLKQLKVGSMVTVDGGRYAVEPFDGDDTFPPAVAGYEIKEGVIFYHGRNGSEGVVSGSRKDALKWMAEVEKLRKENPPEDSEMHPWTSDMGGKELVAKAQSAGDKAASEFGIKPVRLEFNSRKADYGIGGDAGHESVSVVNAHLDKPAAFDFKAPGVTQGMHFAAHEVLHKVYSENVELGKEMAKAAYAAGPVSIYGSVAGPLEALMELGAAYVTAPEALEKFNPKAYAVAQRWAQESRKTNGK